MNSLRLEVGKIFKGAGKSFHRFPAAIVSAILVSLAGLVKIRMEWDLQQSYNLLFDSIQYSFLLGAIFSMAAIALYELRSKRGKPTFLQANISGLLVAIISFLLLYFYGGIRGEDQILYLSSIAMARGSVAIFISIVGFIYIISKAKSVDGFSGSFFISHRAFIISAIYGLVIMLGISGVLGAFQALVYRGMDYRIYQYLGVIVGFLTYTIFLGYFPSFKAEEDEDEIKEIEEQPRFIFVLLDYILIPIMMALTFVLLIWSIRVLLRGIDLSFNQLSGIASSYVIVGIWLHIMVDKHETKIANFYKRAYPFAGILILIFEAWALFVQLSKFGLKTAEYSFLMIWIFALISILLLIFLGDRAYRKIAITAIVISIIWVLPIIGYEDITFNSQVKRLEKILVDQEFLIDNQIVASKEEIGNIERGEITDAVDFIASSEKTGTPSWFKKNLEDEEVFKDTFGFEKTYGLYPDPDEYRSSNYRLKADIVDISDYSFAIGLVSNERGEISTNFEKGDKNYEVIISEALEESNSLPKITVKLEGESIIEEDMGAYLKDLSNKYPPEENREFKLSVEDMSLLLEGEDIALLLVFENIDIYFDPQEDEENYYVEFQGVYIR